LVTTVPDDANDPPDEDEVFDQELTDVLAAHGDMLEEKARALLANGKAAVELPQVALRVRLRQPRWWRQGVLEVETENKATGEVSGSTSVVVAMTGTDGSALIQEITIHLAVELAHGHWRSEAGEG
jgi:hypothetical protein